MNVAIDIIFCGGLHDPFGALDVNILETEVPIDLSAWVRHVQGLMVSILCRVVTADQIVYDIGVTDTGFDRGGISKVIFLSIVSIPHVFCRAANSQ